MTYLTSVCEMLSHNPCTFTVALGGMLLHFCFLRPRWKWWIYPVLLMLTFLALPTLFWEMLHESSTYSVLMARLGYWIDIIVVISFRDRLGAKITLLFTLGILNRLSTFLGYILYIPLNVVIGRNFSPGVSVAVMLMLIYSVILLVCWLSLREKGRKLIQTQISRHNWAVLAGFAVSSKIIIDLCSDYAFALNPSSDSKIILALTALCIFSIAVLGLYLYGTITTLKHSELKAASDRLALEKESQQRYYEALLQNQEELRRIKHDMHGHLSTVSQLLKEDNKDEAVHYLASLSDYAQSHQKKLYSEDPYLNAVVTNYATVFVENNTTFEHEIQPSRMQLHHVEMCMVLNNALQNALEASLKLPPEQRYVKLQVKTNQSRFLFRLTNRFDREIIMEGGVPKSTKKDAGHGYGLRSICEGAESLGGFAVCKIEGDMFVLDVAI